MFSGTQMLLLCYNTVRDYAGLAFTSSLLVKELFSPVNVITSSLLVTKLVRLSSDGGKNLISQASVSPIGDAINLSMYIGLFFS